MLPLETNRHEVSFRGGQAGLGWITGGALIASPALWLGKKKSIPSASWKSESEIKGLAGLPPQGLGRSLLFQLLVTSGIPWLVVAQPHHYTQLYKFHTISVFLSSVCLVKMLVT